MIENDHGPLHKHIAKFKKCLTGLQIVTKMLEMHGCLSEFAYLMNKLEDKVACPCGVGGVGGCSLVLSLQTGRKANVRIQQVKGTLGKQSFRAFSVRTSAIRSKFPPKIS